MQGRLAPHDPAPPSLQGGLEQVYRAALALGTANQLTNILRDVGEDVNERNRIYVPLDELDQFGIRESEVHAFLCAARRSRCFRAIRAVQEFS